MGLELTWGGARICIIQGDITEQAADAIVNAANASLLGGGGVDGAIHSRGGPEILEECRLIRLHDWPGGLPVGKAVVTRGGKLSARYVIHTVGPVWKGGQQGESKLLGDSYLNSLYLAKSRGFRTIAFPSISTGVYGYPIAEACKIALSTVKEFVEKEDGLNRITFVLFSQQDLRTYEKEASKSGLG